MLALAYMSFLSILSTADAFTAVQRSTYNYQTADLAIDLDPVTCSRTGYEAGSWWFVDFGDFTTVSSFTITGALMTYQVRIGNNSKELALKDNFYNNDLCNQQEGLQPWNGTVYVSCFRQLIGRYLSVHSVDPTKIDPVNICDFRVYA